MPRHNRSIEGGKIRKRGCSSSSSSSSVLQNYRFKRALLVARRGGSSTPVPTWKMSSRSPTSSVGGGIPQSPKYPPSLRGGGGGGGGFKTKQAPPVSARKLAATLWEMNEVPSPSPRMGRKEDYLEEEEEKRINNKRELMRVRGGKDRINATTTSSVYSASLPPHLSDPSHSPVSERLDRSGTGSHRRRTSAMSQRFRLTDHNNGGFDSGSNANLMEIDVRSRGLTPTGSVGGVKNLLKDLSNGLTTSKELLKILGRIWGLEEHHSSSMSLVSALRGEVERAHGQVTQLIREHRADRNEINYLMKYFAEEKAAWKRKEQERIQAAMNSVAGDLEAERKLRRRTESLNKTLGRELADTKAALSKAVKELESEKRAREITEQICDELARGIGEDKAEVEELKRESAIVREEVEKEREMLHLADVLREERVQMKLSEAKYQFEEKNAAVDKLRNELEAYLKTKKAKENNQSRSQNCESNEEIEIHLSKAKIFNLNERGEDDDDDDGEVDHGDIDTGEEQDESAESDLHSIELNMDNARSYRWNYANGAAQEDPRRASVEEEIKGRKSTSEKITRGNIISLERRISDGTDQWDFNTENLPSWEGGYNRGGFSELLDQQQQQLHNGSPDFELENQRYKSMKGLRDDILSRAKIALAQGSSSPTRQWGGQPRSSRDPVSASSGRPSIVRERSFKGRLVEDRGGESRIQDGKKIKSSFS